MVRRGRLVAVEGGSASGKTTLVRVAAPRFGWRPLPEAVDRLDPAPSIEFDSSQELLRLEATLLAEESHRYREARRLCQRGETVLADTGFLGPLTYTLGLVELGLAPASVARTLGRSAAAMVAKGTLGVADLTIYLRTTAEERALRARRSAPAHPVGLRARHEAVGRLERRWFEATLPRLLSHRFRTVRASIGPVALARQLGALVERTERTTPASRPEAAAVLSALVARTRAERRRSVGPNR